MRNKLAVLFTLFFVLSPLCAKSNYITEPGKNEVVVVGRISVSYDTDKAYLLEAFDVPEEYRALPDTYVLPYIPGEPGLLSNVHKAKELIKFDEQAWGINGGFFFVKYELKKDRILYFDTVTMFLGSNYNIAVKLPFGFKVKVPEGEKYLYLGDFYYKGKGFAFDVTLQGIEDNFEEAQIALDKVTKREASLCRGNLADITEEDIKSIEPYYYESVYTNVQNWYKRFDTLLEEDE